MRRIVGNARFAATRILPSAGLRSHRRQNAVPTVRAIRRASAPAVVFVNSRPLERGPVPLLRLLR
jgi:hypothetical protein